MQEQYIGLVISDLIANINYFSKVINGSPNVNAEDLYLKIKDNRDIFKLLIDNILKKTTTEEIITVYNKIYLMMIPWLKEVLAIEKLKFIFNETLEKDHTLVMKIYIEDTYYGDFNPINGTYQLPNLSEIRKLEEEMLKAIPKITELESELTILAKKIQRPKDFFKEDTSFKASYIFNKKKTIEDLKRQFSACYTRKTELEKDIAKMNAEYQQYQDEILKNRYYDDKLNRKLSEKLGAVIDNNLIFEDVEKRDENIINIEFKFKTTE